MADDLTISPAPAQTEQRIPCPRCGVGVAAPRDFCPRCGAPMQAEPAAAQDGCVILIAIGALIALAGLGYVAYTLIAEGAVLDGALSIAGVGIGAAVAWFSIRALNARRWRTLTLPSEWVWLGTMLVVWVVGLGVGQVMPALGRWVFPPLIVVGAWVTSLLFLSATTHGLTSPAGRHALTGRLASHHRVFLSASVSASFSTTISLLLEGIAFVAILAVMLATTHLIGDQSTFDLLARAAKDPQALERLEESITQSPAALAGVGCLLVFVAPAIEELMKALPLFFFARQGNNLGERTAILLGVAGGVGFAFAENVGYLGVLTEEWALSFWFRAAAAMMHGAASGFVGRAWYRGLKKGRWGAMLLDLCKGWGIHAFWNALAVVVGWFAYREVMEGVLFTVGIGLVPLAILFTVLARWGIWVNEA
jgi:RsiW-degrading membrane proteinase PrsW (M82 family)